MIGQVLLSPLFNLLAINVFYGVAASCWLTYVILPFQRSSVKFFHIGVRISLFVHTYLVLFVLEVPLHDRSAIVLLRGIQVISCSFGFLRFCRLSAASTSLRFSSKLNCEYQGTYMMNRLLIRYSTCFLTSSAMPCSIPTTKYNMFCLVFGILRIFGIAHDPRSLRLHVVPSYRFVEH